MKRFVLVSGYVVALAVAAGFLVYLAAGHLVVRVPSITNAMLPTARTRLASAHLRAGDVSLEHGGRGGLDAEQVVSQRPLPGAWAWRGTAVDLRTTRDDFGQGVPSVIGFFARDARSALSKAGYWTEMSPRSDVATSLDSLLSLSQSPIVTTQTPAPGTARDVGTTVTVTASLVHQVSGGMTLDQMRAIHGPFYLRYGVPGPHECNTCHSIEQCTDGGCHQSKSFSAIQDRGHAGW